MRSLVGDYNSITYRHRTHRERHIYFLRCSFCGRVSDRSKRPSRQLDFPWNITPETLTVSTNLKRSQFKFCTTNLFNITIYEKDFHQFYYFFKYL